MWVIFEGLDKAGKTTLEWEFLKATNFKHIVIDRGPVGYMVFDRLFHRDTEEGVRNFANQASKVTWSNDFMVVYCKVAPEVAAARLAEHNEKCPYDYKEAQRLYDVYMSSYCKKRVVELDTNKPIAECVELILGKLKEVCRGEL